jgi:MFS family permease
MISTPWTITATRADSLVSPARLTALNFGIQFIWGAILAVSLQARCIELGRDDGIRAYATLAASGAALAAIVQIVVGRLADTRRAIIGHRREWYWCALAAIPALLWFYLASTLAQAAAAFYLLQVVLNSAAGPYQTAIPDHTATNRQGESSSWMSGYQSLGNAAGLLVAGFVSSPVPIALLLSAGLIASFALTITHVRDLPIQPLCTTKPPKSGTLLTILVSRGIIYLGFYIMLGFLLFFVRDSLHIRDPAAQRLQTALLFLSFTLAAIPGAIVAGRWSDRCDKRLVVSIAAAALVGALGAVAASRTTAQCYPPMILAGIAWGAFVTADWALACVLLPRHAAATAMGVWNAAIAVPQVLAPLLAAPIVLRLNAVQLGLGPRAAMVFACCAFTIGAALLWRIPAQYATAQTTTNND